MSSSTSIYPSSTHTGFAKPSSRLRITTVLLEEPLTADFHHLHEDSASMGPSQRGSVCGQYFSSPPSLCFLQDGSSNSSDGCHDDSLASIPESIYEFALEPDLFLLSKDGVEDLPQATIVTPYWPRAIWVPILQQMATSTPIILDPGTTRAPQFLPRHLHG